MEKTAKKTKAEIQREQVMSRLDEADKLHLKVTTPAPTEEGAEEGESFSKLYEESLKTADFKTGDVVKGRVISIEDDHVLVDINYKSEGIIPKSEFRMVAGQEDIQVGRELDVYIDRIENDEGMMVLSKDRADIIRIWKDISKVVENEEVIEGTVIAKVKGGLNVDIGVKAFLPGSQIELRPVRELSDYIGKKFQFKVIKFNQKRGNIVLSRRVLLSQERKKPAFPHFIRNQRRFGHKGRGEKHYRLRGFCGLRRSGRITAYHRHELEPHQTSFRAGFLRG